MPFKEKNLVVGTILLSWSSRSKKKKKRETRKENLAQESDRSLQVRVAPFFFFLQRSTPGHGGNKTLQNLD